MKTLVCTAAGLMLLAALSAYAAAPSIPNTVPGANPPNATSPTNPTTNDAVRNDANRTDQNATRESRADHQLANWLLIDNRGEVNLAKYAQEHSKNDDVKHFAKQMIEDHNNFIQKLEKFAANSNTNQNNQNSQNNNAPQATTAPAGGQAGVARSNATTSTTPNAAGHEAMAAGHGVNFMQIKQELAKQCGESAMRELEKKQGAEFDKSYIGMQLGMHMQMIDTLKVFKNHASPELAQLLDKGRETAETHFEHAQKIMMGLEEHKSSK